MLLMRFCSLFFDRSREGPAAPSNPLSGRGRPLPVLLLTAN
jgi:hypothetical protein